MHRGYVESRRRWATMTCTPERRARVAPRIRSNAIVSRDRQSQLVHSGGRSGQAGKPYTPSRSPACAAIPKPGPTKPGAHSKARPTVTSDAASNAASPDGCTESWSLQPAHARPSQALDKHRSVQRPDPPVPAQRDRLTSPRRHRPGRHRGQAQHKTAKNPGVENTRRGLRADNINESSLRRSLESTLEPKRQ
jgi:hypothetical protein